MSEEELRRQLAEAQETIRTLREELTESNSGSVALTLEFEKRVEERTAELKMINRRLAQEIVDRQQSDAVQRERSRELQCLYQVQREILQDLALDEFCQRFLEHLVDAMAYPELACAEVVLEGRRFLSHHFLPTSAGRLSEEVKEDGEVCGLLTVHYVEGRSFLLSDEQNLVSAMARGLGIWLERYHARRAVRESQERYRRLWESIPIGLYRISAAGRIVDANAALAQMLGYATRESLLAVKVAELYVRPETHPALLALAEGREATGEFEVQVRGYGGNLLWMKDAARTVSDDDGFYLEGSMEPLTTAPRAAVASRAGLG